MLGSQCWVLGAADADAGAGAGPCWAWGSYHMFRGLKVRWAAATRGEVEKLACGRLENTLPVWVRVVTLMGKVPKVLTVPTYLSQGTEVR